MIRNGALRSGYLSRVSSTRGRPDLSVCMLTEGTYPYVDGGVSTWCHALCEYLQSIEYSILAVTGTPGSAEIYRRAPNVRGVIQLPQWGTEDIGEYVQPGVRGARFFQRKAATRGIGALHSFLEPFERLLTLILQPELTTADDANELIRLHDYFQDHDYTTAFRAPATWACFERVCLRRSNDYADFYSPPSVLDLAVGLRWLHNLLMPVAVPLPDVHLIHATVASPVALVAVIAQKKRGIPFVLTEHGVYLRERYINVAAASMPPFLKRLLIGVAGVSSRLCYQHADVVAPVSQYNARWETRLGVPPERIEVVYNGIDTKLFHPSPRARAGDARPTVVAAAKVTRIKDILTMIRAAAVTRQQVPKLLLKVYGSLSADPAYVKRCRALIADLNLESTVQLAGFHRDPSALFNEGDISVLSSISEGFPYTVIESMACERPVVATDVGGTREAVADCGIVVPPLQPEPLGRGMATLLLDESRRTEMGRRARQRVLEHFRIDQSAQAYLDMYRRTYIRAAREAKAGLRRPLDLGGMKPWVRAREYA